MSKSSYDGPPRLHEVVPVNQTSDGYNFLLIDEEGMVQVPASNVMAKLTEQIAALFDKITKLSGSIDSLAAKVESVQAEKKAVVAVTDIEKLAELDPTQIGLHEGNLYFKNQNNLKKL